MFLLLLLSLSLIDRSSALSLLQYRSWQNIHRVQQVHNLRFPVARGTVLSGILDDINSEIGGPSRSNAPENGDNDEEAQYESLFNDLIFSTGDTKHVIAERLIACSSPDFLQWLEWNMEESDDEEEQQALQELLETIDQVITETAEEANNQLAEKQKEKATENAKRQKEEDLGEDAASSVTTPDTTMSATDVLKKANAIDQAIVAAEASGDDQPSDFMRDAKAERGLGGFNSKGRMRVGGG